MSEFAMYFELGIKHILDLEGYDHLLFIVTLCAVYKPSQWKQILILVTAFTIGHSLTLALSSLDIITVNRDLIETLIPITIILTAFFNIFQKEGVVDRKQVAFSYLMAMGFGLIHGMGFANYFKSLMGSFGGFLFPLFSFNLGIEGGQIAIVAVFMLILMLVVRYLKVEHREWNLFISGIGAGMGLMMIF